MQAFDGVGVDALQNVFEIRPGVYLVLTAGCAKGHEDRGGMPAGFTADEEPVLTAQGDRANGILGKVIIDRDAPIEKICLKFFPDPQRIPDGLAHFRLRQMCR